MSLAGMYQVPALQVGEPYGDEQETAYRLHELAKLQGDEQETVNCLKDVLRLQEGSRYAGSVVRFLEAPQKKVRAAAVAALGHFGESQKYLEHITKCVTDKEEDVRVVAIVAIGQVRAENEVPMLAGFLNDKSPLIQAAACQALGLLGKAAEEQADEIAKKLDGQPTRFSAVMALLNLGASVNEKFASDIIGKCLPDQDSATRLAAAAAVGQSADAVLASGVERIVELLKSEHAGVRCTAATALGNMGEKALPYAGHLLDLLKDDTEDFSELYLSVGGGQARPPSTVRRPKCAALLALGYMGATKYAGVCGDALADEEYEVRLCALDCLGMLGEAGKGEAHKIANCLEDDLFLVRTKACEVIGILKAEDQMGTLPELFEDPAPSVRSAALVALAVSPSIAEGYSNEVFKCTTDQVPSVRAEAIRTLGCMGETGQSYASVIASNLDDQDPDVRAAVCEALGKLGAHGAAFADELSMYLRDEAPHVRDAAAHSLSRMGQGYGDTQMLADGEGVWE